MRLSYCRVLTLFAMVVLAATPVFADTHFVAINGTTFSPSSLIIKVGDTVMWLNNDIQPHTATSGNPCTPNGVFNSVMDPGGDFSYTFGAVGSFPYYCAFHCLVGMRGSITVNQPVPVAATTWGAIKAIYAAQR